LRYAPDLPEVLKRVSFEVRPGEKLGIIGRTGSGKSSLASSLFRAVELSGGKIVIDGIDIKTIPLQELRKRLSIVMQDPVLFSGTVRDNLDPFKEHTDEDIANALRKVNLFSPLQLGRNSGKNPLIDVSDIEAEANGDYDSSESGNSIMHLRLDAPVSSGGSNLSAGQAQLISLARS
jgi:ABC-type multidrug transport system fused ATPase/permease subunit